MESNFLLEALNYGAQLEVAKSKEHDSEDVKRFRGANTPCFDASQSNFVIDSTAHCPRVALLRRIGIQPKPDVTSILSWAYGRAWEEQVKLFLDNAVDSGFAHIEYCEEEDAQVTVEDNGEVYFSLRPDLLIKYMGEIAIVEIKSAQSGGTAAQVFQQEQPKLGAVLQWATASMLHKAKTGWTLYGMMHFTDNYDYSTKQRSKFKPCFKTHFCEIKNETVFVNGKETLVEIDSIITGLHMLIEFYKMKQMPPMRPVQSDIFGKRFKYDLCQYCDFSSVCLQFDGCDQISMRDFVEITRMEVELNDSCEEF